MLRAVLFITALAFCAEEQHSAIETADGKTLVQADLSYAVWERDRDFIYLAIHLFEKKKRDSSGVSRSQVMHNVISSTNC